MTRCGAYTKPVPSISREQDLAVPRTRTMLPRARRTATLLLTFGSTGATSTMGSVLNGLNTCGNPFLSSIPLNAENQVEAPGGMTRLTVRSTAEPRTSSETGGRSVVATAEPRNQATTRIEIALTNAPAPASTARAGCQVMYWRRLPASRVASTCPTMARPSTMRIATIEEAGEDPVTCRRNCGASSMPTTPPPRKPRNESTPTRKPRRYPDTAKAIAATSSTRSSRFTR
jgi:hypothetical protein